MAEGPSSMPLLASVKKEKEGPWAAPEWPPQRMEELQPLQADPVAVLTEDQEVILKRFNNRMQTFWKFVKSTEREEIAITAIEGMTNSDRYNKEACAAMLNLLVQSEISNLKHVPTIVTYIHWWLKNNTDVSAEHRLDKSILDLTQAHPKDVATRALWEIIRMPLSRQAVVVFPRLFVALLVQVFCSTEQMPKPMNFFWRKCRQKHHHPTNPKRFAVLTVKALLCRLQHEDVVLAVECKKGWDTLLCPETHHYAVGLLAREMCHVSKPMREGIARYLVMLLIQEKSHWKVPAMAFLVEFLNYLETENLVDTILQLLISHLQTDCKEMRLLVLRGLLTLCKSPLKVKRMHSLTESLMELLKDTDGELVELTLSVLSKVLLDKDVPIAIAMALQLAETLVLLFDHDATQVRLLSIRLFGDMLVYVEKDGKRHLKTCVHQSLLPLFYHLHDENQCVAETSLETLLQATKFLKKRKYRQLLEREQPWRVSECLLSENRRTTEEYRRQSLTYLESPQESMRETAIKFIALLGMTNDISPSIAMLAEQTLYILRTAPRHRLPFRFQLLQDKLHSIWRR
ncbi:maestro heat-like repeat-containing protein family member 7 [Pithys albifrons albifrons]|uniref:maestro heat-like repeat-containing protein family member 7 n=1 Tax=Pithys albifrons albifrons TaxID=3385563 RepID=UPI003A5CB990